MVIYLFVIFSVVILGDDNERKDSDSRDLIFTTQSLVKKTEKRKPDNKTSEKLSSTHVKDSSFRTPFVKDNKGKNQLKKNIYRTHSETEWVLETQLHKRRLEKDIDNTEHL